MIGERIQQLLVSQGKKVCDLASYSNVTQQAAYKWIAGHSEPRGKKKELIASFFGMPVHELEYGNLMSVTPPRPEAARINATLSKALAEHTVSTMLETESKLLGQRSQEFMQGLRNYLLFRLSGIHTQPPFKAGSCQADAYECGNEYGKRMLDRIEMS